MFIVQNAKYWKTFNVSSELVALFYQSAVQCLILQQASRVQCQSYCGTVSYTKYSLALLFILKTLPVRRNLSLKCIWHLCKKVSSSLMCGLIYCLLFLLCLFTSLSYSQPHSIQSRPAVPKLAAARLCQGCCESMRKLLYLSLSSPLCTSKYNGKIVSGRVARKQVT